MAAGIKAQRRIAFADQAAGGALPRLSGLPETMCQQHLRAACRPALGGQQHAVGAADTQRLRRGLPCGYSTRNYHTVQSGKACASCRSEERRVGKEGGSTFSSWWAPVTSKK